MFLRPHHFQHLHRQYGQHLAFLLDSQFPHRWGVLHLEIDEKILPTGTYRITRCAAILRDGLIVTDDLLAHPLELDLKKLQQDMKGKFLGLYLAIPRPGRAEVVDRTSKVAPGQGFPRRYQPVAEEAVDITTGEDPQSIDCIAINASLLGEGDDRAGYEWIKIAEVTYQEDSYQLNPGYCPPLVQAAPDSSIHRLCAGVLSDLQEGARYVIGLHAQQAAGQRDAASLETRIKVRGLLSSAPHLEGLLGSGASRPFDLYLALCKILGDLVGLQPDVDLVPEAVASYDHENLAGTFGSLKARIDDCLRPIIRRKYPDYPFHLAGEQEFQLEEFRQEWLDRPLYIAAHSAQAPEEVRRWMDNCLIGAPGRLSEFRRRLILGLDRTLVEDPPPEIGLKRDWTIYRLGIDPQLHGPIVDEIREEGRLAVRTGWQGEAGAVVPHKLTLIVKVEEEGSTHG